MIGEIEPCKTWQCFNSFALWLSAIGMVSISAMTLWLTVKDKIVRMKCRFDYGVLPGADGRTMNIPVYILSFTNVGARPITITNFRWVVRNRGIKRSYIFTWPQLDEEIGPLNTKLPCRLEDGEEGHLFHKKSFLDEVDIRDDFLFPHNRFVAWWRIMTFKIQVCTTVGKYFDANIPSRVRRSIFEQYRTKIT